MNKLIGALGIVAIGVIAEGCGHSKPTKLTTGTKPVTTTTTHASPAPKLKYPSQRYYEVLTVHGNELSTTSTNHGIANYKGLSIGLRVEGVGVNDMYGSAVVGNHSQILSSRMVRTANGLTYEALSEQTSPAATKSDAVQYHYWLVVYRADPTPHQYPSLVLAYCIEATPLDGTPSPADQATVLSLLPDWHVPAAR